MNNADYISPKNIFVIGVIHGDEPMGEFFINEYLKNKNRRLKNNLYYIPRLNFSNTRKNKNNVDINRNFPCKNWELTSFSDDYFGGFEPNSEIETQFIVGLMKEISFDAVITIHAPYKIINFDGENNPLTIPLAKKISDILGYPLQKDIGYPTPGSLGTYGAERNIPVITVECDETIPWNIIYPDFEILFKYLEEEF